MPMIDVYAPAGAFADKSQLARRVQVLTNAQVPSIATSRSPSLSGSRPWSRAHRKPTAAGADMGVAHRGSRRRLGSMGFRAHQRRTDRGSAQPDGRRGGCAGGAQRRGSWRIATAILIRHRSRLTRRGSQSPRKSEKHYLRITLVHNG